MTSGNQKVLQPPGSAKLVVVVHDIDLVRPDKYATAELLAFLEHALQHGGFYDGHLDFVALCRTQFIATAGATAADGAVALPPRLARSLHTLAMAPPAPAEAADALLPRAQAAASGPAAPPPARITTALLQLLAAFADAFPSHAAEHYGVSLHDAAALLDALPLYDWGDGAAGVSSALQNEARIRFQCRLRTASERARFEGLLQEFGGALGAGCAGGGDDAVYTTLGSSAGEHVSCGEEARRLCRWGLSDFKDLVRTLCTEQDVLAIPGLRVARRKVCLEPGRAESIEY